MGSPDDNETSATQAATPAPTPAPTLAPTPASEESNETDTNESSVDRRLEAGDVDVNVELHGVPDTITEDAIKNSDFKSSINTAFQNAGMDNLEVTAIAVEMSKKNSDASAASLPRVGALAGLVTLLASRVL